MEIRERYTFPFSHGSLHERFQICDRYPPESLSAGGWGGLSD